MQHCSNGHENTDQATFCAECGIQIAYRGSRNLKQCQSGHLMLNSDETCAICTAKETNSTPPELAPIKNISSKKTTNLLQENKKRSSFYGNFSAIINVNTAKKKMFAVLLGLSIIALSIFTFISSNRYNYGADSISALLRDDPEEVIKLIEPSCGLINSAYDSAVSILSGIENELLVDYKNALEYKNKPNRFTDSETDLKATLSKEYDAILKVRFGGNSNEISNFESVKSSVGETALSICSASSKDAQFTSLYTSIGSELYEILYDKSWLPPGFTQGSSDPFVAYKFMDVDYYYGPGESGWTVQVVSRFGCPFGITAEVSANVGSIPTAQAGQKYTLYVQYANGTDSGGSDAYCR